MKSANAAGTNLAALIPAWEGLRKSAPFFGPIRNEGDYARMNALMEALLKEIGDDEDHPLADLLDMVSTFVADYEDAQVDDLDAEPREVLKYLMEEHGLTQTDLRREVGTQGVVSEILAGRRLINARQAKALAKRFGISPAVFL
jgi:HTH-type transcriptional regulator / antitoxin HigA